MMENIYDVLRRYEFNKTEAETLQELVKKANEKGTAVQREMKALARTTRILAEKALNAKLVISRPYPQANQNIPPIAGIDGSFQKVGGFGGKWYVPISCAIVKAIKGTITDMEVEVVANIEEIKQREYQNVGSDVAKRMMTIETKAINSWAQKAPENSYILLDGPVIDPPSEKDPSYVNLRCAALKTCQSKNLNIVGCVKRCFDLTFRGHAKKEMEAIDPKLGNLIVQFPSDTHLLVFMLSEIAKNIPSSVFLHSIILPIEENGITELYLKEGLRIYFAYLQRDIGTSLLRVEVVIPEEIKDNDLPTYFSSILDLCVQTSYPDHHIPLPVQIAHEKCNIRQGCAEILFDEIMTRARAADPLEQIVLSKLR